MGFSQGDLIRSEKVKTLNRLNRFAIIDNTNRFFLINSHYLFVIYLDYIKRQKIKINYINALKIE